MDYRQAVTWFDSLSSFGIRPGLERVSELLKLMGNPQNKLKYIHIAGTNGKGSFCSMMSGILRCAGFKTGVFTSPFVLCIEEQMCIDGSFITKNSLAEVFTSVKEKWDLMDDKPTSFEVLTAAAILYFYQSGCDFAVMECGMGGKNDCTNVISSPVLAVLMSVSLDHMAYLGDSIAKIAAEKCGIIKHECRAVCYPADGFFPQSEDAVRVFLQKCHENGVAGKVASLDGIEIKSTDSFSSTVATQYGEITVPFGGLHQISNLSVVLEGIKALNDLGFGIKNQSVVSGIKNAYMPARLERVSSSPTVIIDGGHNSGCAEVVADYLARVYGDKRKILVFAMMRDKDFEAFFGKIADMFDEIIFTRADMERSESPEILLQKARKTGFDGKCFSDSRLAAEYALTVADENSLIFAGGSFFLAREIRNIFLRA